MSDENKELEILKAELAAAKEQNDALLAEKESLAAERESLAAENAKLETAINTDTKALKVIGEYKNESGTYAFRDGAIMTRLPDGSAVPTTELIKLANKASYKPSKEALTNYNSLNELTHQLAKERIEHLIEIKYGLIEKIEKDKK